MLTTIVDQPCEMLTGSIVDGSHSSRNKPAGIWMDICAAGRPLSVVDPTNVYSDEDRAALEKEAGGQELVEYSPFSVVWE